MAPPSRRSPARLLQSSPKRRSRNLDDKKNPLVDSEVVLLVNLERIMRACAPSGKKFDELKMKIFVRCDKSSRSAFRTSAFRFLLALQGSSEEEQNELMPIAAAQFLMRNETNKGLALDLELEEIGACTIYRLLYIYTI
jgi:hypothetical protein